MTNPQRTDSLLEPNDTPFPFDTPLMVLTCGKCKSSSWKIRMNQWVYCAGCGADSNTMVIARPSPIVMPE